MTTNEQIKISNPISREAIPTRLMPAGKMPAIGMGTFGSDHVSHEQMAEAVLGAADAGYRHFDCAEVYGNEDLIGESLQEVMRNGVSRDVLWINSKVWNDHHKPADVLEACQRSVDNLRCDYIDLYFLHWPFRNFHPPHCSVESRSPDSHPYDHREFMETWEAMEQLIEKGLVRNIGTSNMTIPKMKLLMRDASIKPAANEMELHPHFQQPELYDFCVDQGIQVLGYCPLGSPGRPERDRTAKDTVDIEDLVIQSIAKAHGIHPASVCLKWAVQRGHTPIPMSVNPRNYRSNLAAITADPLSASEMLAISKIDKGCRLIKGQVFLWEGANGWEDLWDLNGYVTAQI